MTQVYAYVAPCALQGGLVCPSCMIVCIRWSQTPDPSLPPSPPRQPQCVLCMSLLLFFRYTVALVPFFKRLSLPHYIVFLVSWLKISWPYMYGLSSELFFSIDLYMSVLSPVPDCPDYCSFIVNFDIS